LLGSHAEATAAVLAIFLGGLSIGYALFGQLTRRLVARAESSGTATRLLMLYAGVEVGIGVYALCFPLLFGVAQKASLLVPIDHAGLGFTFDVALSTILIGPSAILMGGTIPILTLALSTDRDHASRIHAWIYGFNTAGAFLGALAAAFVLIPRMGLDGVIFAMGAVNLAAGGAFAALDRFGESLEPKLAKSDLAKRKKGTAKRIKARGPEAVQNFSMYAAASLLAGFAMMALQTTLNRIAGLAFGSSHFTFAIIVAIFVLCIALGSLAVSALRQISRWTIVGSQWLVVAYLYGLYGSVEDAPYWGMVVRGAFRSIEVTFYPYHAVLAAAIFAIFAIPIGLSGALLPLLFHHLKGEVGDLGWVAGRLFSWNTIGSLLGAFAGGYALLFWVDLDDIYRIALAALVLEAALLTALLFRTSAIVLGLLVVLPVWGGLAMTHDWSPERLQRGLFRGRDPEPAYFRGPDTFFEGTSAKKVIFYNDDPVATVSVREGRPVDGRLNRDIVNNGKSDGNLIGDYPTMSMLALVPALLAQRSDSCFVIGYGTGVTAGELAALEGVKSVEVAEISHAVIDAAPLFDAGNLNASTSPKVTIRRGDAYRIMRRSDERFNLIISEPSNPWVTGVEMLYSKEFLEAARSRLAPGGVYAQWFHLYETDHKTVELVLQTFVSVFPHASVWYTSRGDLLLLGFDRTEHALDVAAIEARFLRNDFRAGFERAEISSFAALLAHELLPLGTLKIADSKIPVHTLRHPILSDYAARAFFVGSDAQLPRILDPNGVAIGVRNSLLRRYAVVGEGSLSERSLLAAARELCQAERNECATMLAKWRTEYGGTGRADAYIATLRSQYPNSEMLSKRNLKILQQLLVPAELSKIDDDGSLARAIDLSQKFAAYHHPAAPFDRSALRAAWDACEGKGCVEARRRVEWILDGVAGPDD
jgi:spermidine synthase